jgi:hypothetical protein
VGVTPSDLILGHNQNRSTRFAAVTTAISATTTFVPACRHRPGAPSPYDACSVCGATRGGNGLYTLDALEPPMHSTPSNAHPSPYDGSKDTDNAIAGFVALDLLQTCRRLGLHRKGCQAGGRMDASQQSKLEPRMVERCRATVAYDWVF